MTLSSVDGPPKQVDPFEGPILKIERAKRHITDCNAVINSWAKQLNAQAARIEGKPDPQTGRYAMGWNMPDIDPEIRLTAADAIYNLRSALDQAMSCCAILANKAPDGTYFPHGKDKAGFEKSLARACRHLSQASAQTRWTPARKFLAVFS